MERNYEQTKQLRAQIKYELAMELRYYLVENTEERLQWIDTKTHLIELVIYLSDTELMKDEDGMPLSMMRIAKMACQRFNLISPRNLSSYKAHLSDLKGARSMSFLDKAVYRCCNNMNKLSVEQYVNSRKD